MKPPAPPRVSDVETFWTEPPELSPRCKWWMSRIVAGWQRNSRLGGWGYYESAEYFGVYIWEWVNVLSPLLQAAEGDRGHPRPTPFRSRLAAIADEMSPGGFDANGVPLLTEEQMSEFARLVGEVVDAKGAPWE